MSRIPRPALAALCVVALTCILATSASAAEALGTRPLADVTAKTGAAATFSYRIDDPAADGPYDARLVISKDRGRFTPIVVDLGSQPANQDLSVTWKCTLKPGTYSWHVELTDPTLCYGYAFGGLTVSRR